MDRTVRALVIVSALLAAPLVAVLAPTATAQLGSGGLTYCGEDRYGVQLRFHNPDLNPGDDPAPDGVGNDASLVEASWALFPQFQAVVGSDSEPTIRQVKQSEIQSMWFAFGPIKEGATIGPKEGNCEKPWSPGLQLYAYRSDPNPDDGFFVPINTTAVPDGTYGFALYACTSQQYADCHPSAVENPETGTPQPEDSDLVAAVWGRAVVDNAAEENLPGSSGRDECSDDRCKRDFDFIDPWPTVLPGDGKEGVQPHADACDSGDEKRCVTIEFAERLDVLNGSEAPGDKAIQVWVNGIERTSELQEWTPPARDDDFIPGNDGDASGHPASDCATFGPAQQILEASRLCVKNVWGDGFKLDLEEPVETEDEIRIWAQDGAGNTAEKIIAFDDPTRGGVIPLIEGDVEVSVDPAEQRIRPADAKTYTVTITNEGSDTVHTFPSAEPDEGITAKMSDSHVDVPPNGTSTLTLTAGPEANTTEGDYAVQVNVRYIAGTEETATTHASVVVDEDAELSGSGGNSSGGDGDDDGESIGEDFERQCGDQADHRVCFVYPRELTADGSFTFQVQTSQAGETVEQRHDVSVGEADLTIQYLNEDGSGSVAEDDTFEMSEVQTGLYEADVTLSQVSPMVHAIFDSDKVKMTMMIRQPSSGEPQGGASVPGFGVAALVAAGLAAAWIRRRDRSRDRSR